MNTSKKPEGTIILLHGLGADGNDFVPIAETLALSAHIRFVFPDAPFRPVTINQGYVMRAWYDILSMKIDAKIDQEGIAESVKHIGTLIQQENELGIPTEKIILAGFSQGAVIALTTALSFPKKLAGVLALSGYLPNPEPLSKQFSSANQQTPIFLAHGTEDQIVPYLSGKNAYEFLQKHNYSVDWHQYTMGHTVSVEEIKDIKTWLNNIYSKM